MSHTKFQEFSQLAGQRKYDLFTFFCLYIAQALPMTFFATALQITMRQASFSLSAIALTQLIKLPWIVKFLWAPLVDRRCTTLKGFRRCIFLCEGIYALLILAIGCMDLLSNFTVIITLIILSFVASATQDIATDALAVLSFRREEKSMVNSIQSLGSFSATLIGSGILLALLQRFGWHRVLPFLALFVVLAVIPLMRNRQLTIKERPHTRQVRLTDSFTFLGLRRNRRQIVFLLLYYAGLISVLSMVRPWMVDLGYSMKDIGLLSGIIGSSAACIATLVSGQLIYVLGRWRARRLFALLSFVTCLYFVVLARLHPATWHVVLGIVLLWSSYGLSTVMVYTTSMDMVRPGLEGTDFTTQTVITHLSGIIFSVIAGHVAQHFGYSVFFISSSLLALTSLVYIAFAFRKKD
ncbi:MFS transporter [Hallella bergensis]|uniref:MFS transporter n=1 Tax=Hallella bergensis TaxID=242750 RepID=UPI00399040AC